MSRGDARWSKPSTMLLLGGVVLASCGGGGVATGSDRSAVTTTMASTTTSSVGVSESLVAEDVVYREPTEADGEGSTVDIYVGDGNEGGPTVVLLHGWGPTGPGRPEDDLGPLGDEIAELGTTVFYFGWQTGNGFHAGSVADLSCVGPFVAARAAEFGADPDQVIVIGHSMGAETGAMLAFSSFDLAPSPTCTETGQAASPVAFVGIAGTYGLVGGPIDDDHTRFRVRRAPGDPMRELDADEDIWPGLSAADVHQLNSHRAIPPVAVLDIVLVVGSEDQYSDTNADVTAALADALETSGVGLEVVIVDGADHDNIVDPTSDHGQATLEVIADVLADNG